MYTAPGMTEKFCTSPVATVAVQCLISSRAAKGFMCCPAVAFTQADFERDNSTGRVSTVALTRIIFMSGPSKTGKGMGWVRLPSPMAKKASGTWKDDAIDFAFGRHKGEMSVYYDDGPGKTTIRGARAWCNAHGETGSSTSCRRKINARAGLPVGEEAFKTPILSYCDTLREGPDRARDFLSARARALEAQRP